MALPRIAIDGRLAADPTLRFSPSGTAVAGLRVVAVERRRQDDGTYVDGDQLWVDVTCFGKLAENVCESVVKGDLVLVQGKLRTDEWNDAQSGQKRSRINLIADAVGPSLQFRQTPHGKAAPQRDFVNPVQQAYGDAEVPAF